MTAFKDILDQDFPLTTDQIQFYRQHHYIKLKDVFPADVLSHYSGYIDDHVKRLHQQHVPLEERSTYDRAFLQIMNLWTHSEEIREFVFNRRLAQLAARLMGTQGVRLYHDQALYKEPYGGFTPWHADQYYWPLATDNAITAWIPLHAVPVEMGPLEFSSMSHTLEEGRGIEISDTSEKYLGKVLKDRAFEQIIEPFDLGEISFHSGWIFHRAGPNQTEKTRKVMTMIYIDSEMTLKAPENENQQNDWDAWCPGAQIGEIINTPLNPVLYQT